ncbi:MAG: N-acetylmuramoyl-L-alanine amidase [Clostridium sp.]
MECIKANVILDNKPTVLDIEMATIYAIGDIDIKEIDHEVLKVLAVLKRSEVVKKVKNTPYYEKDYEVSIRKRKIRKSIKRAVDETRGVVVLCGNKLIQMYFTMCCSGSTANSEDVIGEKINYIRRIYCDKCSKKESYRRFSVKEYEDEIGRKSSFREDSKDVFSSIERDDEGRIKTVSFLGDNITGNELMKKLDVKSNKVYFKEEIINLKIEGEGEGLGICIEGAGRLASEGKTYKDIINYYYTGVEFEVLGGQGANTLNGKVFLLDPGHGGVDRGNSREGLYESEIVLGIVLKLKELIEERRGEVHLTREDDVGVSLTDRAAIANKISPDFLISVHLNAFIMPGVNGAESYCFEEDNEAMELSQKILDQIENGVGIKKRKVNNGDVFLLRESRVPSIILECLYITGNKDIEFLNDEIKEKIANAMFMGICDYYDINV